MDHKEFAKTLFDYPDEIFPKGTDPQTAVDILAEHFLGAENLLITGYSATKAQWNSEVVHEILKRYPSGSFRRIHK